MSFVSQLKKLDAHPKINEDFFTRTLSGGLITLVSSVVMTLLFISEFRIFLTKNTDNELFVDTSRGEQLQINIDVTFPELACAVISLDAMDISGDQHLDVVSNVFKRRLDANGDPKDVGVKAKHGHEEIELHNDTQEDLCLSCYGAEENPGDCCNTCDQVRDAYRRKGWAFTNADGISQCKAEGYLQQIREQEGEGCNVYGILEVNKVAGNFHFAPGKSFQQAHMHVHDLMPFQDKKFNVSHVVNKLSFGADFPGVSNPLDGIARRQKDEAGMYQYFIKVVPTMYSDIRGRSIASNQFSVTEHFKKGDIGAGGHTLPGVFFFYDFSPLKILYTERHNSFLQFVTSICAIIGGIFTVSGIIDSLFYHGQKVIKKKIELGKFS